MLGNLSQGRGLAYLDASVLRGRAVEVMPYWDGTQWHCGWPTERGLLPYGVRRRDRVRTTLPVKAQGPTDLMIPFVDFLGSSRLGPNDRQPQSG